MARPRKWNSEAERLAAYRASKAQDVDPELPERDVAEPPEPSSEQVETMEFEGKQLPVVRNPDVTLQQFLAAELAITQAQIAAGGIRDVEVRGESTLQRSERYLRWRYAGYCTDQVASL